jgi:transcriptional regulator with XRE-family HTH domain
MPDKPSASRARALGAELKALRRKSGMNTTDAAKRISISAASLNRTELATRMPTAEEVSGLLVAYGVEGLERERVLQMARDAHPSGWWEMGGGALPKQLPTLITFESQAIRIVHFQPLYVPGLLQTHAYMRAVMDEFGVPIADAEARVAARAGRQTVLTRRQPPRYQAIIDEAALLRTYGGRKVMADQIRRIIELAELPNITIQVIPFARGGYALYGPYVLLQFSKARDIVHLEHKQAAGFLDEPEHTAPFQSLTDTLKAAALGPAETCEFLAGIAADYDGE